MKITNNIMWCICIARFQVENILFIYSDIYPEIEKEIESERASDICFKNFSSGFSLEKVYYFIGLEIKINQGLSIENENENEKWDQEHDHESLSRRNICEKLTFKLSKYQNDY